MRVMRASSAALLAPVIAVFITTLASSVNPWPPAGRGMHRMGRQAACEEAVCGRRRADSQAGRQLQGSAALRDACRVGALPQAHREQASMIRRRRGLCR